MSETITELIRGYLFGGGAPQSTDVANFSLCFATQYIEAFLVANTFKPVLMGARMGLGFYTSPFCFPHLLKTR